MERKKTKKIMKSEDQPNSCIEQEWELRVLLALELTLGCKGLGGEQHVPEVIK